MSKNILYLIIGLIVLVGAYWFFMVRGATDTPVTETPDQNMASTTDTEATTTPDTTGTSGTGTTGSNTTAKSIPGYPASWPADVPKYPVDKVDYSAAHNPSGPRPQNSVVFSVPGTAANVRTFYLNGLTANGWAITENGAGLANQITLKAAKGKRTVVVYIERVGTSTNVTVGANIGT